MKLTINLTYLRIPSWVLVLIVNSHEPTVCKYSHTIGFRMCCGDDISPVPITDWLSS